jgi:hypothetical protein
MTSGGTQLITADGVVGTSGSPVRIFAIHILSGAAGGGVVLLRTGTGASGAIYIQETGNTNDGKTVQFGAAGYFFPAGCYCDIDSNTTSVAISYIQQ